jgi:putative chitinase
MYKQLIIQTCLKYGLSRDEAAYVLGTADWETNHTFEPVKEAYWLKNAEAWRKKNLKYYPWYGRGFVQLTHLENYIKAGKRLGIDLTSDPDKALDPQIAAEILVVGMKEGWFTGKDLDDYIDSVDESVKEDFLEFYNARRVVNGMDKANEIAVLAEKYEKELSEAKYGLESTEKPTDGSKSNSGIPAWVITLIGLLGLLWTFIQGRINK